MAERRINKTKPWYFLAACAAAGCQVCATVGALNMLNDAGTTTTVVQQEIKKALGLVLAADGVLAPPALALFAISKDAARDALVSMSRHF